MIYSKTCEYAIRALTVLAKQPKEEWISVQYLADVTDVPAAYIAKIMQKFVKAKILVSRRGPVGGYRFLKSPEQISLMNVISTIEEVEAFKECIMGLDRCEDGNPCPLHDIWKRSKERIQKRLKETHLKQVTKKLLDQNFRQLKRSKLR